MCRQENLRFVTQICDKSQAMDKSSTPSVRDRKAVRLETDCVPNVYMRANEYYCVKMDRGKRHFVPLADSKGRPVCDLPEAIRAIMWGNIAL
jgi:hypothetical protein